MEVNKLEKQISTNPTDESLAKYNESKRYIEEHNNEKANGAILRSKINWVEYGEKNSKFFLNLEKRNYNIKCITKLIKNTDDEQEISNPEYILKYEEDYYKTLYSENSNVIHNKQDDDEFKNKTLKQITENERNSCEIEITTKEIGIALRELKMENHQGQTALQLTFINYFG